LPDIFARPLPNLDFVDRCFHKNPQYNILRKFVQWEPGWYMRTDGQMDEQTWQS